MTAEIIEIQTGARLHFGPLSHRPERGRHFGGIGMMVNSPGYRLKVRLVDETPTNRSQRVQALLERIQKNRPEWTEPVDVQVEQEIPAHVGFGSGTQFGLAVTEAIALLHDEKDSSPKRLASYSRRGQRSSVGLYGYLEGGFLVDSGHQAGESIGQIACHFDFPEQWPILLVTPQDAVGQHGTDEAMIFASLSRMRLSLTGELCHLTLTEILPSVKHADFKAFAPAIYNYGKLVGGFFSASQGGIFSHKEMEPFVDRLQDQGVIAVAQSSWGPSVAIFTDSSAECERVQNIIEQDKFGQQCQTQVTTARNNARGLTIH